VIESAKAEDEIGFVTYFKAGFPVTIVSMVVGIGYLLLTG
jgi:Na+/H+ antiporter NhaD/arsenite permease-like protein